MDALTNFAIARLSELNEAKDQIVLLAGEHPLLTLQAFGAASVFLITRTLAMEGR